MKTVDRLIANVQVSSTEELIQAVEALSPYFGTIRVDMSEAVALGCPEVFGVINSHDRQVFFDCRLNLDPQNMADTVIELARAEIGIFSVQASAGMAAMKAAVANKGVCQVLAVTVPPHFSQTDCERVYGISLATKTIQLAHEAKNAGVDGILCSSAQLRMLRQSGEFEGVFMVVTNILPSVSSEDKGKGVWGAFEAVTGGADAMVVTSLQSELWAVGAEGAEATRKVLGFLLSTVEHGLDHVHRAVKSVASGIDKAADGVGKAKTKVDPDDDQ
ncbi:hypothetical protein KKI23_01785 [Patescibacteria group bacterium]|nr:hypothetical protein [Patescibacteria group bacterium]